MIVKNTQSTPSNWYAQQTVNVPGTILLSRRERDWNLNQLRDNVIDYTKPLFTNNWSILKNNTFIDKEINPGIISFSKPWSQLQSLNDKYAIIRLKFDTFNDVNLIFYFSLETEQPSI